MNTNQNNTLGNPQSAMAGQGRVVILGAGESGVGAAKLAKAKGFEVFVSDFGPIADKYQSALEALNVSFESAQHTETLILNATEVIKVRVFHLLHLSLKSCWHKERP